MRVLSAMAEVTCEQGVEATTVTRIVNRAGISRRTFYELFADRGECLAAVFEVALAQGATRMGAAFESRDRWVERTRAALSALLGFLDEEPELARVCVVHAMAGGPRMIERRASVLAGLARAIDEGRGELRGSRRPPPLTAEGLVGAVFAVIYSRLVEPRPVRLRELCGPLMSMIVLPYLGGAAADRELVRPIDEPPAPQGAPKMAARNPLEDVQMRVTYRTLRVLEVIAAHPGASNRQIAAGAGVADQGQISRLLARLDGLSLIENSGAGPIKGAANAWTLTAKGGELHRATRPVAEQVPG